MLRGLLFPKERFLHPDDEVPLLADADVPVVDDDCMEVASDLPRPDPATLRVVASIHRRLGHPSRDVLLRMLRLGGAPAATVAGGLSNFPCPLCESIQPPPRPPQSRPHGRPAGFNVEVHVDLKYAQSIKGGTFVALSMICAGTNKHHAILLKTRKASYVARKFIKHWIGTFGRPSRIVMDQGGEFEKEWGLDAGALRYPFHHNGVTCGLATRLWPKGTEGFLAPSGMPWWLKPKLHPDSDMAVALAGAIEAKNELVSRKGYSANMMVFWQG